MPLNLTYQIAKETSPLLNTSISALLGVIIGWLLNLTSSTIHERQKNRIETLQKKKQVYCQFVGLRASTSELYFSRKGLLATYYYLQARDRLGMDKLPNHGTIFDFDCRLESSELEMARNHRELAETVGLIEVSFSPSPKLNQLIEGFFEEAKLFQSTNVEFRNDFKEANTEAKIESLKEEANKKLGEIVWNSIVKPMDNLADHLKREIETDETKLNKPIWRIFK